MLVISYASTRHMPYTEYLSMVIWCLENIPGHNPSGPIRIEDEADELAFRIKFGLWTQNQEW